MVAYLYGCGGCGDESKVHVAYLMKYTEEGKKLAGGPPPPPNGPAVRVIATVPKGGEPRWVNERGPEAGAVQRGECGKMCKDGAAAVMCE